MSNLLGGCDNQLIHEKCYGKFSTESTYEEFEEYYEPFEIKTGQIWKIGKDRWRVIRKKDFYVYLSPLDEKYKHIKSKRFEIIMNEFLENFIFESETLEKESV